MAEVFGVVAGAVQLAATCLSLVEFTKKIKGASSSLRNYQRQLQEVRSLSEAIFANPLLQTPEVGNYICSLLTLVNEQDLRPLIERGRLLRSWAFLSKDRELSEIFDCVERSKTTLALLIHNLQAQAIHHIQADIQVMAHQQPPEAPEDRNTKCPLPEASNPAIPSDSLVLFRGSPPNDEVSKQEETSKARGEPYGIPGVHAPRNMTHAELEEALKFRESVKKYKPSSTFYYGNTVQKGGQYNGDHYSVTGGGPATAGSRLKSCPKTYVNNHAIGPDTAQKNGCDFEYSGDDIKNMPDFEEDDDYFNNTATSLVVGDVPAVQRNGHTIRVRIEPKGKDD